MPTSTDPYNSSGRLVEADDVLEPLDTQAIPESATSAQEAAIASVSEAAYDVQGALSLEDGPVDVTQVPNTDVFDETAGLAAEESLPFDPTLAQGAGDIPERPEATLADGSAYAPSPASAYLSGGTWDAGAVAGENGAYDTALPNTEWAAASQPIDALPEAPKSRVKVHIGIFFATILLVPLAWYLFSDSSIRLASLESSPWETGKVSVLVLLETAGALIVAGLIWFLARASSLGVFVSGVLVAILGAIGVVVPFFARQTIANSVTNAIGEVNTLTGNIAHHFAFDLGSGHFLFYGFLLLMTGVVSHYARRRGTIAGKQAARRDIALGK